MQMHVLDLCLQLTMAQAGDLATEDRGDLFGLADVSIQVQQALGDFFDRRPSIEDLVIAVLHLRKEQPMLTPRLLTFGFRKEGGEIGQPLLAAP